MSLKKDFKDKYGPWALVTGASSGIGEQFARLVAAEGINVILVARRADRLQAIAEEIRNQHGVEAEYLPLDLSDPNFIEALIEACGGKDIGLAISNAGFGLKGLHHEIPLDRLSEMLDVNCRATLKITHTFIPGLIERGRGGIILTGSMEGFFGVPWSAAYSATKAFVLSFGEALWGELRKHNIDVLVLAPGSTDTDTHIAQGISREDLPGLKSPEEVAKLGLEQLGRRPVYVTGFLNRQLIRLFSRLPRKWAVASMGAGIRKIILQNRMRSLNTKSDT
jgi:short-subunit dehydrogenase